MTIRLPLLILTCVFCLAAVPAQSASPVWKVSKGDHHLFIGGTIHLLTPEDYPLPAPFDAAFEQSGTLVFETDLQQVESPEFQLALVSTLRYPAGENLQQDLSKATLEALQAYCLERGLPLENIVQFKAGMASMLLTIMELQRLGLVGTGVDAYYSRKGLDEDKRMDYLETPEAQLAFIASMGEGQEDELIAYTLEDSGQLAELFTRLKSAWRVGDLATLSEISVSSVKEEFPDIYEILLVKRNQAWMHKIESMLKTDEIEFVMVGALHLAGQEGVLEQLTARGYTIQML